MIAHWLHHQTSELRVIHLKLVKDPCFYRSPPTMDFYFLKNKIAKKKKNQTTVAYLIIQVNMLA